MHLLNEIGVVAEIADTPFRITHGFAMLGCKLLMPLQTERCLQIEGNPAFFRRTLIFEIVDIQANVIDHVVTGISAMMTDENLVLSALLVAVMVAVDVDATGCGAV